MQRVVLITGVSRYLGRTLAVRLSEDPSIERIIGIDSVSPRDLDALGRAEFVRADIRNPLIAKVVEQARIDTVVHTGALARARAPQVTLQDQHVTGTMQLLAACQTSESVSRIVVASSTAVYGSSAADPAQFTEHSRTSPRPAARFARDAVEIENYVRGFVRRRPDVPVAVLRLAPVIGPNCDSALSRFLSLPVVPSRLGFDPRLQVLHETDAVEALRVAALNSVAGVVNVAADGVVPLSQALRWGGRPRVPVLAPSLALAGSLARGAGLADVSLEEADFLTYGRVVDTERLHRELGYRPRISTEQALRDQLSGRPPVTRLAVTAVGAAQRYLTGRAGRLAGALPGPLPAVSGTVT